MRKGIQFSDGVKPTGLSIAALGFSQTLQPHHPELAMALNLITGGALLAWMAAYGIAVWRQAAKDKAETEAKYAAATAQLFTK